MENESPEFLGVAHWIHRAPPLAGIDPIELTARDWGETVVRARSSWTRRGIIGRSQSYVKTYDYPSRRDRRRGWLRTTWLARSRAAREAAAIAWLLDHGFAAPTLLGVVEWRLRSGVLRRAAIITEAWDGEPLERLWPRLAPQPRTALRAGLEAWVERLHRAGFRDRNLDPRNILVRFDADGAPTFCKLDSPRYRLNAPGERDDRLARADRERLRRGLDASTGQEER